MVTISSASPYHLTLDLTDKGHGHWTIANSGWKELAGQIPISSNCLKQSSLAIKWSQVASPNLSHPRISKGKQEAVIKYDVKILHANEQAAPKASLTRVTGFF